MTVDALAYDAIASDYDAQVQGDDWMRRTLHAHYFRVFGPGDRVLDVGCGTGIDAIALARGGVRVVGIDASLSMITQLRGKLLDASDVGGRVDARVLRIEELRRLDDGPFDGIVGAFASLSTLPDLGPFADDAARLVRPGGRLVLHMLNRFSLWEWLGYLAHRDWPSARRVGRLRTREFTIGGQRVVHTLYFPLEAHRRFFATRFALRAAYGLGTVRPPHTVRRIPRPIVHSLEALDVRCSGWPLLRDRGRFFVLDLERLPSD